MIDPIIIEARNQLVASKQWGAVCETAILNGAWDNGALVRERMPEAEQALLRHRREARDE